MKVIMKKKVEEIAETVDKKSAAKKVPELETEKVKKRKSESKEIQEKKASKKEEK